MHTKERCPSCGLWPDEKLKIGRGGTTCRATRCPCTYRETTRLLLVRAQSCPLATPGIGKRPTQCHAISLALLARLTSQRANVNTFEIDLVTTSMPLFFGRSNRGRQHGHQNARWQIHYLRQLPLTMPAWEVHRATFRSSIPIFDPTSACWYSRDHGERGGRRFSENMRPKPPTDFSRSALICLAAQR